MNKTRYLHIVTYKFDNGIVIDTMHKLRYSLDIILFNLTDHIMYF